MIKQSNSERRKNVEGRIALFRDKLATAKAEKNAGATRCFEYDLKECERELAALQRTEPSGIPASRPSTPTPPVATLPTPEPTEVNDAPELYGISRAIAANVAQAKGKHVARSHEPLTGLARAMAANVKEAATKSHQNQ